MRDKPILMCGDMVRVILGGRKTQTRRIINPQPVDQRVHLVGPNCYGNWEPELLRCYGDVDAGAAAGRDEWVPKFKIGDRLWVRETWRPLWDDTNVTGGLGDCVQYKADMAKIKPSILDENTGFRFDDMCVAGCTDPKWKPSIFMPRWASRITLEITGVKVERVNDISGPDVVSEGIPSGNFVEFMNLWDSINAKRGFGSDVNPWVWVIQFRRVS